MERIAISKPLCNIMSIVENYGPEIHEYALLNSAVKNIITEKQRQSFKEWLKPMLFEDTLFGHTYTKPFGYAGDYLLIEKIYQKYLSADAKNIKWDKYYHSHKATDAVRNRKGFFVKVVEKLCSVLGRPVEVLILGSGPATDVYEFLNQYPAADIHFDLLDIDQRAIDYAAEKNKEFMDRVHFIRMNVLRFTPCKKYDLIWSAGLFDYLNDRFFIGLVNRFKNYVKEDGEMIIGNFSPLNPTRKVMEIFCEWYLIHRSGYQLTHLALNAGLPREFIRVDKEPLGINLFLRIGQNKIRQPASKDSDCREELSNVI